MEDEGCIEGEREKVWMSVGNVMEKWFKRF